MTPQQAQQLQPGSIILYQSQTWRAHVVDASGFTIFMLGKYGNTVVPTAKCLLAYTPDEVPAGYQPHILNDEELAILMDRIQERIRTRQ